MYFKRIQCYCSRLWAKLYNSNKNLLPKDIKEYYCNSHQELIYKFQYWNKHKYILPNEKKIMIQKNLFSNLTDGNIKLEFKNI